MCSHLGCFNDATPFTSINQEEIFDIVENTCGFLNMVTRFYSGFSGKQMSTRIFIGPTYYQRLKHMVKDKINSRQTGKVTLKTKQPPSGRANGGGLRIGEMERDAILSHGALHFLKETMMERPDKHEVYVSENSGLIGVVNHTQRRYICPSTDGPIKFDGEYLDELSVASDNSKVDIVKSHIPYNTALMGQECMADMGISMRLITEQDAKYEKIKLDNSDNFIPQDLVQRTKKDGKKGKGKGKKQVAFTIKQNSKNDEKYIDKMKGNKINIKNLTERITDEECKTLCCKFGTVYNVATVGMYPVREVRVTFTKPESATLAVEGLDKRIIDDEEISVELHSEEADMVVMVLLPPVANGRIWWPWIWRRPWRLCIWCSRSRYSCIRTTFSRI